jgi:hypothetical protein
LAGKLVQVFADGPLRAKLGAFGLARGKQLPASAYDAHLRAARVYAAREKPGPISVSPVIFSNGDLAKEEKTLASLGPRRSSAFVLRLAAHGWTISGVPFELLDARGEDARLLLMGQAVLGLRAGDTVKLDWLDQACEAFAGNPTIGVLSCWLESVDGVINGLDHVVIDHAMNQSHGLRRIIRIPERLLGAELVARMKAGGEVSLMLDARARGLASLETPMVGVEISSAIKTPAFDIAMILGTDYPRIDPAYLALRERLVLEDAKHQAVEAAQVLRRPGAINVGLSRFAPVTRCQVRTLPHVNPGEVWLLAVRQRHGALPISWRDCAFSEGWEARSGTDARSQPPMVSSWHGHLELDLEPEGELVFLQGPFCGAVEVFYRAERHVLNLRSENVSDLVVRIGDLQRLSPMRPYARPVPTSVKIAGLLERAAPAGAIGKRLLIEQPEGWIATVSAFGVLHRPPRLSLAELGGDGAVSRAAVLLDLADAWQLDQIVVAADDPAALDLLAVLVRAAPRVAIMAALKPDTSGFAGATTHARAGAAAIALAPIARAHPTHLTVAASCPSTRALFAGFGCKTHALAMMPPAPAFEPTSEGLPFLALLDGSRAAPTLGHLAAAAASLARQFPSMRVFVPAAEHHIIRVLEELGVSHVQTYASAGQLAAYREYGPCVALAAYPDASATDSAAEAVGFGFVPVTGPAPLYGDPALSKYAVTWWEDAEEIAMVASQLFNRVGWATGCATVTAAAERAREAVRMQSEVMVQPAGAAVLSFAAKVG